MTPLLFDSCNSDGEQDDEPEEKEAKVWDMDPEQVAEQRVLASGGYVGVRRVVSRDLAFLFPPS